MYEYTISQWVIFFFIYCVLGWIWESCYVSFKQRKWVNRGFMHGPMLPIYGAGAIIMLIVAVVANHNIGLTMIYGMIAATTMEYFTGATMERLFHVKYWDYTGKPFNLHGHICLAVSISWGLCAYGLNYIIHQPIAEIVLDVSLSTINIIGFIVAIGFTIDFTLSFIEAIDLKHTLEDLAQENEQLKMVEESVKRTMDTAGANYDELIANISNEVNKTRIGRNVKSKMGKVSRKVSFNRGMEALFEDKLVMVYTLQDRLEEYKRQENKENRTFKDLFSGKLKKPSMKLVFNNSRQYAHVRRTLERNPVAFSKKYAKELRQVMELTKFRNKENKEKEDLVAEDKKDNLDK